MTQPPYSLRPYQKTLIQHVYRRWQQQKRIMAQLSTGGGKTVIFSAIANDFVRSGKKVLILAHREELVAQAATKVKAFTGKPVGIVKAGYALEPTLAVQVASVQSLVNRLVHFPRFDLIVIDEAHHATASTYRRILDTYPNAYQLGVTATPVRLDGSGFQDLFEDLLLGPTLADLIAAGHLSPFRLFADRHPMTTQGVKTQSGDFSAADVAKANNAVTLSGNLIQSYRQYGEGTRCVVFAVNVAHSQEIAERYRQSGIAARHLDGNTPETRRREVMEQFRQGEIQVLSNCGLFDEGLDIPHLETVQIAKPTRSLTRWLQMVGRALRTSEGKKHAILIDHTRNWAIHGLPTRPRAWTLEGVREEPAPPPIRTLTGEVVEARPELAIFEQDRQRLLEIETSLEPEWMAAYRDLCQQQQKRGHSVEWVYARLLELKPPVRVWQQYAEDAGYGTSWAWQQYQSLCPLAIA
jgi:superfamily II DNA or RNA helicase